MRGDTDESPQWYKDGMAAWAAIQEEAKHAEPRHAEPGPEDQEMLDREGAQDPQTSQQELVDNRVEQQEPEDDTAMELDESVILTAAKGKGKEVAESSGSQSHAALLNQLRAKLQEVDSLRNQIARAIQHRESVPTAVSPSEVDGELVMATQAVAAIDLTGTATCTDYKFKKCDKGSWHLECPEGKSRRISIRLDLHPGEAAEADKPADEQ